jgi:hypothetical protein
MTREEIIEYLDKTYGMTGCKAEQLIDSYILFRQIGIDINIDDLIPDGEKTNSNNPRT